LPRFARAAERFELDFTAGLPAGISFRRASPAFADSEGGLLVLPRPTSRGWRAMRPAGRSGC
jgi:hypothetical protein